MIYLKTHEEIELLRENNLLVSATLAELAKHIKPGVTTLELDKIAEDFIRSHGAVPSFLGYNGFSEHALHVGQRTGCTRDSLFENRFERRRYSFGGLWHIYEGVLW